jgi:cytoskeleton protein RodZ
MEHSLPVTEAAKSGSILTAERTRQGLTVEAVAEKLRLRPYQVEALESGDFSRLPQGTFLRGFMKNYAKLLGIEPERVLAALNEQVPAAVADPGIVVPSQNIRYRTDGAVGASSSFKGLLIAVALLVAAFVAVYAWMSMRGEQSSAASAGKGSTKTDAQSSRAASTGAANSSALPAATSASTPNAAPAKPAGDIAAPSGTPDIGTPAGNAPSTTPTPSGDAKALPLAPSSSATPAGSATASSSTAPTSGELPAPPSLKAGDGNTTFTFAAKSWLQIRDARGRVIHQREHEPGSTFSLDVPVGASLIVGNSKSVRMMRIGREVDLAQHTDVNVARLKVE